MKGYLQSLFSNSYQDCICKSLKLFEKQDGALLLDLGCGDGSLTMRIAEAVGAGEVYGIDIDQHLLAKAREKGIKAFKSNLNQRLHFEDNLFDVVFSFQTLEHLDNIDIFVKEVRRVLKLGGYAIMSTENLSGWHNIFALILGFQDFSSQGPSNLYRIGNPMSPYYQMKIPSKDIYLIHKKISTYRSLRDIFQIYGFKVEKTVGAGYYPFSKRLSSALSSLDPIHSHFLVIKIRKPQ